MIHTVDMQPKCLNIVSHMGSADLERGQEVQSGSVHHEHLEGESCFTDIAKTAVGRATKAKGIQLCLN